MDEVSKDSAETPRSPHPKTSSMHGLRKHLSVEVTTSHADILLLICCIISGLVDSTIYNAYGTFVSMQTVLPLFFSSSYFQSSLFPFFRFTRHGSLRGRSGQHNIPRPRRCHSPLNLQTLRLGQILPFHHLLLSRLLRLQLGFSSSYASTPLNSHRIFLPSITGDLGDGCDNTSGDCERKLEHHHR